MNTALFNTNAYYFSYSVDYYFGYAYFAMEKCL